MSATRSYVVDIDHQDREGVRNVCLVLTEVLEGFMDTGSIDGYSDFPESDMDQDAKDALDLIRKRAESRAAARRWRRKSKSAMGIDLDLRNDEDRRIFHSFGPWSIHAEAQSRDREPTSGPALICLHDSGYSITTELSAEEAATVENRLPPGQRCGY